MSNVRPDPGFFADEVFRVFRKHHPEVELHHVNACKDVEQMISRAESKLEA